MNNLIFIFVRLSGSVDTETEKKTQTKLEEYTRKPYYEYLTLFFPLFCFLIVKRVNMYAILKRCVI